MPRHAEHIQTQISSSMSRHAKTMLWHDDRNFENKNPFSLSFSYFFPNSLNPNPLKPQIISTPLPQSLFPFINLQTNTRTHTFPPFLALGFALLVEYLFMISSGISFVGICFSIQVSLVVCKHILGKNFKLLLHKIIHDNYNYEIYCVHMLIACCEQCLLVKIIMC